SNGKRQPSRAFGRGVELDRPDRHADRVQPLGINGRDDWSAVVGHNDVGPCPLLDARKKAIINDESSDGDAAKALVDRPDRLGSQEEEPPLIGQGGGGVDLVGRLSDEGNEPRAELIRRPELSRRVTAGDHFEIAVIYREEIEVGEPCERLDDLRDYALVVCVDCVPEVGYLRDQLGDVIRLLELIEKAVTCRVHSLPGFDAVPPDKIIVCADEDETDDGDQQHRAPDHREQQLETKRRPERSRPARPTKAYPGPHAEPRHCRSLNWERSCVSRRRSSPAAQRNLPSATP